MKTVNYLLALVMLLAFSLTASAQHGMGNKKSMNFKNAPISKAQFQKAVRAYVKAESNENSGFFVVKDDVEGKEIKLTLVKIHNDDLSYLGNDTYFVCSDFRGMDGRTYDLDIFMKGTSPKDMKAQEISIHKVNGVERYKWKEVTIFEKEEVEKPMEMGKKDVWEASDEDIRGLQKLQDAEPQRTPQRAIRRVE